MIWLRNLLFIGLVCGGVIALGANLMPPREPTPITQYDVGTYRDIEFVASVARVDNAFRDQWKKQGNPTEALVWGDRKTCHEYAESMVKLALRYEKQLTARGKN